MSWCHYEIVLTSWTTDRVLLAFFGFTDYTLGTTELGNKRVGRKYINVSQIPLMY